MVVCIPGDFISRLSLFPKPIGSGSWVTLDLKACAFFFPLEALQTVLMNQKLDRAGTAGKLLSAQHSPRHGHRVATSHRHYMERKG